MNICLLVSGDLGYKILKEIHSTPTYNLAAVFTDKRSETIIRYCQDNDLALFKGNPRNGAASSFIQFISCEVLLSVNYLFIIDQDLISLPSKIAVNLHGSLLPKYRGRTPHVWAIINGEKEVGISAHVIDEEVDNGGILKQIVVAVGDQDTGADILERYKVLYPKLVKELLVDISNDDYTILTQDNIKATYFGKRTPKDGKINWDWSKERIRNWIRAQATPYPGAYSFYGNKKVGIHRATYDDRGFHSDMANGTILAAAQDHLIIKTSNGALKLDNLECDKSINFKEGTKLE